MKRLSLAITAFAALALLPAIVNADTVELLEATRANDVALVSSLLDAGVDPNAAAANGVTALHVAASFGYAELSQVLVKAGADIDAPGPGGNTPLMLAAQDGHLDIVQLLIDADADVEARSSAGGSAMELAAAYGHRQVVAAIDATYGPAFSADSAWKWVVTGFVLALTAVALLLTRLPNQPLRPVAARAA
jgi:ankyrin repeat protein